MPMKIGLVKIVGGINQKKKKYVKLPVSVSPSTSPSGSSSFSFSWPTIKSKRAHFAACKTSYYKQLRENSGKCKENMQDGAIVHLTKDGTQ